MKHTRRFFAMFLSLVCVLALAACGGGGKDGGTVEAPDLNQYYEDFMATLGEDNTPAMMDLEAGRRMPSQNLFRACFLSQRVRLGEKIFVRRGNQPRQSRRIAGAFHGGEPVFLRLG